ncbi:nitrate- and nitrite sensing domain-containing protein [Streptomyces sp. NPDC051677]|uniref:sensor histidine kinase n=1 Tax=Streptomyces sp. NPDC051677 TaxID=3365669 RepID=UPI0037CEF1FE
MVPSVVLVSLWSIDSARLYDNWKSVDDLTREGKRLGEPVASVLYGLQAERQLSVLALADPAAGLPGLDKQRKLTDRSVRRLQSFSGSVPAGLMSNYEQLGRRLGQLPEYRDLVDRRITTQEQVFDDYTGVIASNMQLFEDFANVGFGEITARAKPVFDAQWGQEMLSRENAILNAATASGHLTGAQRTQLTAVIGNQEYIYRDKVVLRLPAEYAAAYRAVLSGAAWQKKARIEQSALATTDSTQEHWTSMPAQLGKEWDVSYSAIATELARAGSAFTDDLAVTTQSELDALMRKVVVNSVLGGAAVLLVFIVSLRLTRTLRRRIFVLRDAALELQTRLPNLVERLRQGEAIDADTELPEVPTGSDELGMLARALNQARSSALETVSREVEQHRGFERLLQRIARRTQLLIGMQMKRLGEMQRQHEDPDILEGLFDIDHLAARLRRYEENLVILGGGQPQRRWRKPVLLLDVLRSAQGEVQDYRRIRIDTQGGIWMSERAVGPLVHILAELMENAVSFSKPPTPVEVSVSWVGRGVVVEIEDRGMGMDLEQYAEANHLMANPPHLDVMSRSSDDARLGLYVVARLAANLGLCVELRPSSFGGTRVVVLVPRELISSEGQRTEPLNVPAPGHATLTAASPAGSGDDLNGSWPGQPPSPANTPESTGRPLIGPWARPPAQGAVASEAVASPLPRRVRQASLASELRTPRPAYAEVPHVDTAEPDPSFRRTESHRSGSMVGAFQRQSRKARFGPDFDQSAHLSPSDDRTRKEDKE